MTPTAVTDPLDQYLTDDVTGIVLAIWPSGHRADPKWNDENAMRALHDALLEAGYDDPQVLASLRGERSSNTYDGNPHWHRMPLISAIRSRIAERKKEAERESLLGLMAARIEILRAKSKLAYSERRNSDGYWLASRADLLERHPGYVSAIRHDLRGTPPPGVIWIRPATSGKWSKSRREKFGRPLTVAEMEAVTSE